MNSSFSEAKDGSITLSESVEVVENVLDFMYGVGMSICGPILPTFATSQDARKISILETMIAVYVAGDKYAIPGIQDALMVAFVSRVRWMSKPESLISLADTIYENTLPTDQSGKPDVMRLHISELIQTHLKSILANPAAQLALLENHALNADLLQKVADATDKPTKLSVSMKRARAQDNEVEGIRRSPRNTRGAYKSLRS
jgi:hypothetical protein